MSAISYLIISLNYLRFTACNLLYLLQLNTNINKQLKNCLIVRLSCYLSISNELHDLPGVQIKITHFKKVPIIRINYIL